MFRPTVFLPIINVALIVLLLVVGLLPGSPSAGRVITALILAMALMAINLWHYQDVKAAIEALLQVTHRVAGGQAIDPSRWTLGERYRVLYDAFNDMSDQIARRRQQLEETVDRMSTVLAAMEEGVIAVDNRQRILFANRAAGRLLGFDPTKFVGKQMLGAIRNHMLHEAVSETLANRSVGEKKLNRYELDTGPGSSSQTISLRATQLPGQPCPGVVLVLEDVSELRRLEYLRQEFVANVSHELKTPLTAIKAYAETLSRGAIDDPNINRQFLAQIETESDRLHDLIIDMLRLAQIELGHDRYEIASVNLAESVNECLERHREPANHKQITLEIEASPPSVRVQADEEGLREILDNLIDNAIKYTPPGGSVSVRWEPRGNRVALVVSDTGVGIPRKALNRVFERFYRVDKARSRELGSTGLGLSIVKHVVQSFGGSVSAESEEGKGSVFTVELPSTVESSRSA